jgi:hypothetical protein
MDFFKTQKKWIVIVIFIILFLVLYRSCSYKTEDLILRDLEMNNPIEDEQSPEVLPEKIRMQLEVKYNSQEDQKKAVLQYANALWIVINTDSEEKIKLDAIGRAVDCLFIKQSSELMGEVRDIVIYNKNLFKKYTEFNRSLHGRIFSFPEPTVEACD